MASKKRRVAKPRAIEAAGDEPRRNLGGRPRERRHTEAYEKIGAPPVDQLDALGGWAHKLVAQAMYDAAVDRRLSDRERWQHIRAGARALNTTMSKARLRKAEKMLRDEANQIAAPRRVELEPAPGAAGSPPPKEGS